MEQNGVATTNSVRLRELLVKLAFMNIQEMGPTDMFDYIPVVDELASLNHGLGAKAMGKLQAEIRVQVWPVLTLPRLFFVHRNAGTPFSHAPVLFSSLFQIITPTFPHMTPHSQAIFHYRESVKTKKTSGSLPLPQDYELSTFFDAVKDDCNFDEGIFEEEKYTWVRSLACRRTK